MKEIDKFNELKLADELIPIVDNLLQGCNVVVKAEAKTDESFTYDNWGIISIFVSDKDINEYELPSTEDVKHPMLYKLIPFGEKLDKTIELRIVLLSPFEVSVVDMEIIEHFIKDKILGSRIK